MDASKIFTAFVIGILAIILITVIAGQIGDKTLITTKTQTVDLSVARNFGTNGINTSDADNNYTLTSLGIGTYRATLSECIPSTITVKNQTGSTMTVNTDYTYSTTYGKVTFLDTIRMNTSSNSTDVIYNYCPDGYMAQSWGRSTLNLVSGFLVLMLVVAFAAYIYFYTKEK